MCVCGVLVEREVCGRLARFTPRPVFFFPKWGFLKWWDNFGKMVGKNADFLSLFPVPLFESGTGNGVFGGNVDISKALTTHSLIRR